MIEKWPVKFTTLERRNHSKYNASKAHIRKHYTLISCRIHKLDKEKIILVHRKEIFGLIPVIN